MPGARVQPPRLQTLAPWSGAGMVAATAILLAPIPLSCSCSLPCMRVAQPPRAAHERVGGRGGLPGMRVAQPLVPVVGVSAVATLRGGGEDTESVPGDRGQGGSLAASSAPLPQLRSDDSLLVLAGVGPGDAAEGESRTGAVTLRPGPVSPATPPHPMADSKVLTEQDAEGGPAGRVAGMEGAAQRHAAAEPLPIPEDADPEDPEWNFLRKLQRKYLGDVETRPHPQRGVASADSGEGEREGAGAAGTWFSRVQSAHANVKQAPDSAYKLETLLADDDGAVFPDAATADLWWACVEGHTEDIGDALARGAQVNFSHPKYHARTALHYAAALDATDAEPVTLLLAAGADVNAEDEVGCRPLHFAAESWDPDKVRALVEAGAERTHCNGHGFTPLQVARHMYDVCDDPALERNPDYDPAWEREMMELLSFPGASLYPSHWPRHSAEEKAIGGRGS